MIYSSLIPTAENYQYASLPSLANRYYWNIAHVANEQDVRKYFLYVLEHIVFATFYNYAKKVCCVKSASVVMTLPQSSLYSCVSTKYVDKTCPSDLRIANCRESARIMLTGLLQNVFTVYNQNFTYPHPTLLLDVEYLLLM